MDKFAADDIPECFLPPADTVENLLQILSETEEGGQPASEQEDCVRETATVFEAARPAEQEPDAKTVEDTLPISAPSETPSRKTRSSCKSRKKLHLQQCAEYVVKFKGNNSARWDGKEISVDAEWLEELYEKEELHPGCVVKLPWESNVKGSSTSVDWRAVIIQVPG